MKVPCLLVLLLSSILVAAEFELSIPVDPSAVAVENLGPFARVTMPGTTVLNGEGLPGLPVMPVTIALPTGTTATGVDIVDASWIPLGGRFEVMPNGPALPLSVEPQPRPIVLDQHIYGRNGFFPFSTAELTGSGPILGIPVADLRVFPVRWNPVDGRIEVLSSLTVRLTYESSPDAMTIARRSAQSEQRSMNTVRSIVINPEGVSPSGAQIVDSRELAYGEYVIITHPDFQAAMQELADWKTSKGVPTNVYTTTWIQSQYTGYDLQQEIKGFLIDCRDEGVEYVLIAGDDDKVAARDVHLDAGGYTEAAPCDLYFADNNDTAPAADHWDSNNNHVWGEFGVDQMEYHPDFWLGRASVQTAADAALFVDKVLIYEHIQTVPSVDYFETAPVEERIGYSTGYLWDDDGVPVYGSALAYLVDDYIPSDWEQEGCHEEVPPGNSVAITQAMINAGPHHVMHSSHGAETGMYTSYGNMWTTTDIMALTNVSQKGAVAIWNSISCLIGAIDTGTCCGDAWNRSPNGGGFGAFNSRFGWGMTGVAPGTGLSNDIVKQFYVEYMDNGLYGLGEAHAVSVDQFLPPADEYWHWCALEYNLLGDPELPMWTTQDMTLSVTHPASISQATSITVTVNGQGGAPLSGARVCLQKGNWQTGEVYSVGLTNTSGQVILYANPATTGTITVRAWAHNYDTYTGSIAVTGTGIEEGENPMAGSLGTIFPSPAFSAVTIPLSLAQPGRVRIDVYDLSGRMVSTVANADMSAGRQNLVWSLTGNDGRPLPSGIYTVRASGAGFSGMQQLVVVR
jgi:hypothetical protein